jgi:hypothetical protein
VRPRHVCTVATPRRGSKIPDRAGTPDASSRSRPGIRSCPGK